MNGTSSAGWPPLRLMMAAAPTTLAPAARSHLHRLPAWNRLSSPRPRRRARVRRATTKPRRSVSTPSWRSAKMARTPSPRATSWPMTMPPRAGDRTQLAAELSRTRRRDVGAAALGLCRVLQHQRALQIAGAVQPGRQAKMPSSRAPTRRNRSRTSQSLMSDDHHTWAVQRTSTWSLPSRRRTSSR